MHTQFYQPTSRSQEWGKHLGGDPVKNWTRPKGSGGRVSPDGLSSSGEAAVLILSSVPPNDCSFQRGRKSADHTKKGRSPDLHLRGSVPGCRLSKGAPRDGEAGLLVHAAPSSPLCKHKEDGAENCQSRTFPRLLTTQVCTRCGSWAAGPRAAASPVHLDPRPDGGLWLPEAPPSCSGFPSISDYS